MLTWTDDNADNNQIICKIRNMNRYHLKNSSILKLTKTLTINIENCTNWNVVVTLYIDYTLK